MIDNNVWRPFWLSYWGEGGLLVGGQGCSKHSAMHRTVPPSTVLLNNVNRATIQKPCPRGSMLLLSLFSRVPDSVRSHRWQPMRLPHPWDSPGKNTGVGCHFLLQEMRGSIVACNFPNLPDHKSFLGEGTVLIKNTGPDLPWPTESDTPGLRPGNSYFKQLFWVNFMIKQVWENSR